MLETAGARPVPPDRLGAWAFQSPVRAVAVFALGYVVWQPTAHWLFHAVFGEALAFRAPADWARFEVAVAGLGALSGAAWAYTQRWALGTWRRLWADWGIPGIAMAAIVQASALPHRSVVIWIACALVTGAVTGAFFASVAYCLRSGRSAPPAA